MSENLFLKQTNLGAKSKKKVDCKNKQKYLALHDSCIYMFLFQLLICNIASILMEESRRKLIVSYPVLRDILHEKLPVSF